jgi:hypothetical protein
MSGRISYPGCPREASECRITMTTQMAAYVAWTPVYDGNGLLANADPNHATTVYNCATCGNNWTSEDAEASDTFKDPGSPKAEAKDQASAGSGGTGSPGSP